MMRKDNFLKISGYVLIFIFIAIVAYGAIYKLKLLKNNNIAQAKITFVSGAYRGGMDIKYEYFANKEKILSSGFIPIPYKHKDNFINKYFPVVYYPKKINQSEILILPSTFKKYNFEYPDSLEWVRTLLSK